MGESQLAAPDEPNKRKGKSKSFQTDDTVGMLANAIWSHVPCPEFLVYAEGVENGKQDTKVLKQQVQLLKSLRAVQANLSFKEKDMRDAMAKVRDLSPGLHNLSLPQNWDTVMGNRIRTMCRHMSAMLSRTTRPKWVSIAFDTAPETKGDEEKQEVPDEDEESEETEEELEMEEDLEEEEEEEEDEEEEEETKFDEETQAAESNATMPTSAADDKCQFLVGYDFETGFAEKRVFDEKGNEIPSREMKTKVIAKMHDAQPDDACIAVFSNGERHPINDLRVKEWEKILLREKRAARGLWVSATKNGEDVIVKRTSEKRNGVDNPLFRIIVGDSLKCCVTINHFKNEADAKTLAIELATSLCKGLVNVENLKERRDEILEQADWKTLLVDKHGKEKAAKGKGRGKGTLKKKPAKEAPKAKPELAASSSSNAKSLDAESVHEAPKKKKKKKGKKTVAAQQGAPVAAQNEAPDPEKKKRKKKRKRAVQNDGDLHGETAEAEKVAHHENSENESASKAVAEADAIDEPVPTEGDSMAIHEIQEVVSIAESEGPNEFAATDSLMTDMPPVQVADAGPQRHSRVAAPDTPSPYEEMTGPPIPLEEFALAFFEDPAVLEF